MLLFPLQIVLILAQILLHVSDSRIKRDIRGVFDPDKHYSQII